MNFNRNVYLSLIFALIITQSSFAQSKKKHPHKNKSGKIVCFPKNRLFLKDDPNESNLTEDQFNKIIDNIVEYYKPIAKTHGYKLAAVKHWKSSEVNAAADADEKTKTWQVHMYGGLARRPEITPDGFALVVCHEIGHHLGGYPFYPDWGSSEGQADYFATQACAKAGWGGSQKKNLRSRDIVDEVAKDECDLTYKNVEERALCYREADAALSMGDLLATLDREKSPELDTPDETRVTETNPSYPSLQCRLDTFFQGALCTTKFDEQIIPQSEDEARKTSCMTVDGFEVGFRPRCWFKPSDKTSLY